MPYLIVAFLALMVGLVSFLVSQSMVEKVFSVVIPLVLTVVLIGMAKARGKRVAAEQHSARMRMIAEKPVHEMRLRQEAERLEQISAYQSQWDAPGIEATVVGGSGYGFAQHHRVLLGMKHSTIYLLSPSDAQLTTIASQDINELDVSGPGTVRTDAGIVGGGFGLEGFVKGAVAAALINAATTRVSTNTFARILTAHGEIYLHTSAIDPESLRIKFSPAFVHLANRRAATVVNSTSLSEELQRLKKLTDEGALTQEEFEAAKKVLLK